MNYWMFVEPAGNSIEPVWTIYSEDGILSICWETWKTKMIAHNLSIGRDPNTGVSPRNCIYDWITVHWAMPATPENLLNIISAPKPQLIVPQEITSG